MNSYVRKNYARKTSNKYTQAQLDVAGKYCTKIICLYLFKEIAPEYKLDLTEKYIFGDIITRSNDKFVRASESECKAAKLFDMVWNHKWEPNLLKKKGLEQFSSIFKTDVTGNVEVLDYSKISQTSIYTEHRLSKPEDIFEFYHFLFPLEEAMECFNNKTFPSRFIYWKLNPEIYGLQYKEEISSDADGNKFKELKSKVPLKYIERITFNSDTGKFTRLEKYKTYTKNDGNLTYEY